MDPEQSNQTPNINESQNTTVQTPKVEQNTNDTTNKVGQNKIMAALSYLCILIIIPFLVAKNDPYVKFHLKQGLLLIIIWAAQWILDRIFFLKPIMLVLSPIISIATLVLIIIGIINAVQGKQKELPIIGKYGNKLNF